MEPIRNPSELTFAPTPAGSVERGVEWLRSHRADWIRLTPDATRAGATSPLTLRSRFPKFQRLAGQTVSAVEA